MGGLLFKTERKKLTDFNKYRKNIEDVMNFFQIEYEIPLYYRDKKDFGDLDIIIKNTVPIEKLLHIFSDCECHYDKSETVVSFNYENFQIDFIRVNPEDFGIAFHYFSYNDLGNLIGQIAKYKHLKFGFDGLKYNHYVKGQKLGSINISKNIDDILRFLDLDPIKFHQGFDSMKEVFDYVVKSKYFNPYAYDMEPYGYDKAGVALYRLNKINRDRNSKRKTYQEWLEYVKRYKTGEDNYTFRDKRNIEDVYDEIDKFFPKSKFGNKLRNMQSIEESRLMIKEKFNGNIIMELLPDLNKKSMQSFINDFKCFIEMKYDTFNDYIINTKQDIINDDIIRFFDKFKKEYI